MHLDSFWKYLQLIALSGVLAFAAVGLPSADPFSPASIAQADDDDDGDEDEEEDQDDEAQGRVLNGQVLGIYEPSRGWSKAPGVSFDETTPQDQLALRVGRTANEVVPVVLYNPHTITEWGLQLGDHVSIDGEFVGGTFYGSTLEVTDRCC